jgi:hypothetical protein
MPGARLKKYMQVSEALGIGAADAAFLAPTRTQLSGRGRSTPRKSVLHLGAVDSVRTGGE